MANLYIAEFATTGGVNGGAPSGSTGSLPGLPWTPNNSFNPGTNPNFRNLQVIPIAAGVMPKPGLQPLTDTIAVNCDAGNTVSLQLAVGQGVVVIVGGTPQTFTGKQLIDS